MLTNLPPSERNEPRGLGTTASGPPPQAMAGCARTRFRATARFLRDKQALSGAAEIT